VCASVCGPGQLATARQRQEEATKDLQRQLRDLRKEYHDYKAEQEHAQAQTAGLQDVVESLTLGADFPPPSPSP
jgi:chromosome segregation ATPase